MSSFTADELAIAKTFDLVAVADSLGYTPKKIGRFYTLKEMDSIRIYNRTNWFRWSMKDVTGHNGGSQIDFLKEFMGMDVKSAVFWLLDFAGYKRSNEPAKTKHSMYDNQKKTVYGSQDTFVKEEEVEFSLPTPATSNKRIYAYLNKKRCISLSTIDYFVNKGLIYESADYHNIVFRGNDSAGVTRQASMRGLNDDYKKKPFKMDVAGSNKNYGFNIANDQSDTIIVFEGAIDLMSYIDIFQDYDTNMIALGMVSDRPLERFLKEHSGIKNICLCLDNDEPGRKATQDIMKKYVDRGFNVKDMPAPAEYKDINEWLVASRLSMTMVSEKTPEYIKKHRK
ncbi:MAG: DUF3991 and TOPRIM domain-containing protein [Eubacterium sp.]|nr:DUF3991 and TOPRIM domain-containing protein [Eubacterium sp.]